MSDPTARVTATVEEVQYKDKTKDGNPCKAHHRVKLHHADGRLEWASYWDKLIFKSGDTITFREKRKGGFYDITAVNVVPPGQPAVPPNPAKPLEPYERADYYAALRKEGMTTEEVGLQVDRLREVTGKDILSEDAALVAVAAQHGVTIQRREVATPATPEHPRPETGSISETTFDKPPQPEGPLCRSPWSDKSNDVRYSLVKFDGDALEIAVGTQDVEEIWHLWSHPRLLFIKRAGTWTTQPAKGHRGVVYRREVGS